MLSVREIHTYYGDSYVVQGVTLHVDRGQIVTLMGRNGAGKTTTIRSIVGLTPPRYGSVLFDGKELTRLPTHEIVRRGIALVPQGRRVFASLTVREHLAISASRRSAETWTMDRLLEVFPPLKERLNHRAIQLSGGEQSMLAIARALRMEPECLLMDEPTEGLAPFFVESVLAVVRSLKARGLGILVVVHELPIALSIADQVYIMERGRVVFEGSLNDLKRQADVLERHVGIGVEGGRGSAWDLV